MSFENFESYLEGVLANHFQGPDGKTPPHLEESIRYSLLAPGKRIRPRLLLACSRMLGVENENALPPAAALEMIHCFTLIHDDLPCMDNDDFRRGRPSNHKKFGESTALLAGDALISLAGEVFLTAPSFSLKAYRRLLWASGPRGVIGGQAFESTLINGSSLNDLRQMHRQKTGALFSAALLIPMDLVGIQESSAEGQKIAKFADELGLAFQVMDDLHDWEQDQTDKNNPQNLNNGIKPISILHYLPREKVIQQTLESLTHCQDEIVNQWGKKAENLTQISNEILIQIS